LRPTFIGDEYFKYVVEEIINKEGDKERSLITLN